jgi:hypothetical protein
MVTLELGTIIPTRITRVTGAVLLALPANTLARRLNALRAFAPGPALRMLRCRLQSNDVVLSWKQDAKTLEKTWNPVQPGTIAESNLPKRVRYLICSAFRTSQFERPVSSDLDQCGTLRRDGT